MMQLSVLVVEDDTLKFGKVHAALVSAGIEASHIAHSLTASDAVVALQKTKFDLMLLDINIPRRLGEGAVRGAGLRLLKELKRDPRLIPPAHVVGITAYEDVVAEFGEDFARELWSVVLFRENSEAWAKQIKAKVAYLQAQKASSAFSDGVTYGVDLAIVCALADPELKAVKDLPCSWQPLHMSHDETRYLSGTIEARGKVFSAIAAASPRMGMPAAAVLSAKIIAQFRPRFLGMCGICAGRIGKVNLGDIIVADPVWDWGSGKIQARDKEMLFRPSPHQIELDLDLAERLKATFENVGLLATIKSEARGRKPDTELRAHFGPMASGAAVIAHPDKVEELLNQQHRALLAIEMEAYGVATACKGSGRPRPTALILKSVCDYADEDKTDDYQEYAAHTSAIALFHAAQVFL